MPEKIRSVHLEDVRDDHLAALSISAALTRAYLPTVLDDEGRAKDQPAVLNGQLWPLRAEEHPTAAMDADLAALTEAGVLCRYRVGEQALLHDPSWKERQKPSRALASALPPCPLHDRSFDEAIAETMSRFTEQVNTFVGAATSRIDSRRIEDSVTRLVEDITYLMDPEKAAARGQKVRKIFEKLSTSDKADEAAGKPDDEATAG
ncbi:MAG TPA: hypothetical protein VGJ14_08040 [Sporichthyaceae bacterium]